MLRTSSYLAIALGLAAIGSVATPAAALPSQVFAGANPHIAAQLNPVKATTGVQGSREASHILGPQKIADFPPKIPMGPAKTSLGAAQVPASKLPVGDSAMKQPQIPVSQLPPPQIAPLPSKLPHPVDDICPFNPLKCKSAGSGPGNPPKQDDDGKGRGPVVIMVPQAPVQMPVQVPVAAPVAVRVATAAASVAATKPMPVITPACMTAADIPALAAGIDELLPTAQLSQDDMTKVTELRQMIQELSTDGKEAAARNVEEVAMYYLGYQKIWLQCGQGTFAWEQVANNDAAQSTVQSK